MEGGMTYQQRPQVSHQLDFTESCERFQSIMKNKSLNNRFTLNEVEYLHLDLHQPPLNLTSWARTSVFSSSDLCHDFCRQFHLLNAARWSHHCYRTTASSSPLNQAQKSRSRLHSTLHSDGMNQSPSSLRPVMQSTRLMLPKLAPLYFSSFATKRFTSVC